MESENNKLEETQPTARPSEQQGLEETRPVQTSGASAALEETAPTPVKPAVLEETHPVTAVEPQLAVPPPPQEGQPAAAGAAPRKRRLGWLLWAIVGIVLLVMIAVASGYAGYLSAIGRRVAFQSTQVAGDAQAQFELGVQDLEAGRYDLARQRFEYVIQLDPSYPGVTDKLAEVLMRINATATPTTVPTPTLTPTPDLRSQEVIFAQAQTQLAAGDWTGTIDTLLTLRKRFPDYQAVKVDGMLFVALRNRGVEKISQKADLEGGIYDLALAGRFGPVDVEAKNWRDWAELYIRGASFWDVDWEQAVYYFSQLSLIAPNLVDGSGYTSTERYRLALIGYGDLLARQERWCDAQQQYETAYNMSPRGELQPTASYAADQCANPTSESQPEVPTATPGPSVTPPAEATPIPTTPVVEQPTPTETPATPYP